MKLPLRPLLEPLRLLLVRLERNQLEECLVLLPRVRCQFFFTTPSSSECVLIGLFVFEFISAQSGGLFDSAPAAAPAGMFGGGKYMFHVGI